MKKVFCFFIASLLLFGCQQSAIEKPDNLIDEDTMENIIYDLSLIEAIKSTNPTALDKKNITTTAYIYDKYDIDSLQFVNSNHYYAADLHNYQKMYKRVEERLANEKVKVDSLISQRKNKLKPKKNKGKLQIPDSNERKKIVKRLESPVN